MTSYMSLEKIAVMAVQFTPKLVYIKESSELYLRSCEAFATGLTAIWLLLLFHETSQPVRRKNLSLLCAVARV